MTTTLEARGVRQTRRERTILHGVDLALTPGEVVGLIGPNGAGKSTLLDVMAGLSKPSAGVVLCDGAPLGRLSARERARRIAYLAQGSRLDWPMRVETVVGLGRLAHGETGRTHPAPAVERAMAATRVTDLAARRADTLSGGERMRVLLARALAVEAPILLADEPIAGLDPAHQLDAMEILRATARTGASVVVVLHDLTLAARFCDRVALLVEGRIVAEGPPASALSEDVVRAAYGVTTLRGACDGEPYLLPWKRTRPTGD